MKITYLEKGQPFDYKRVDHVRSIVLHRTWRSGGLLYGYVDRFNVRSICIEDIISIEE